ncbi:hypothetical protein THMIRHAM_05580 [Thiomicrorhabdus immobilis]|uniref:Endonuclease GajA/Old nuclease/RecF-like AAA domain-containing protein n=1 Tax=Thiomicrorhabdus immobilis TaxID=2791037 RepID=A0ABM7MBL6_9GAMM|nr:AAA family ATPase [Thiomicrorhabdus immobilis]BCN92773.1 hypothetical protein THMIRHAM_05580 [Thiomicrorhabdus immobilis]
MINVYIGENGCGKSRILGKFAKSKINSHQPILAIANTVAHKFPLEKKSNDNYFFFEPINELNAKKNFYYSKKRPIIKEALSSSAFTNDDYSFIRTLQSILSYIGYEPSVGIQIELRPLRKPFISKSSIQEDELVKEFEKVSERLQDHNNKVVWLEKEAIFGIKFLEDLELLLQIERSQNRTRPYSYCDVQLFFRKNGREFDFKLASSGEATLIYTAFFLGFHLQKFKNKKVFILIDEPENSLHPKWQRQYIENLRNIFPYYDFEFHIATHSPIFIAGAQKEGALLHRFNGQRFEKLDADTLGIEDSLIDQFGIVTPQNHSLSERCIDLINDVDDKKLSISDALKVVDSFLKSSFDEQQKDFLLGVEDLIKQIPSGKYDGKD